MEIMNCMHFGMPQKRPRFFLVACHKGFGSAFKWPRRCKLTKTLSAIVKASKHDNPRKLPPARRKGKDGLRRRELVKLRYKLHVQKGINPLETMVITDIGCSKKFAAKTTIHTTLGVFPCITASRGQGCDYWCSLRGRAVNVEELLELQGVDNDLQNRISSWQEDHVRVTHRQMGKMVGNAIPVNIMKLLLANALTAAGLIGD